MGEAMLEALKRVGTQVPAKAKPAKPAAKPVVKKAKK
jgi:hypothetical protein